MQVCQRMKVLLYNIHIWHEEKAEDIQIHREPFVCAGFSLLDSDFGSRTNMKRSVKLSFGQF